MTVNNAVAKRVTALLKERNMSQYRLEQESGIQHGSMQCIMNGETKGYIEHGDPACERLWNVSFGISSVCGANRCGFSHRRKIFAEIACDLQGFFFQKAGKPKAGNPISQLYSCLHAFRIAHGTHGVLGIDRKSVV